MKRNNSIFQVKIIHCFVICLMVVIGISSGIFSHIVVAAAADNTPDVCLNHTGSEGECKDCCDCLDDPAARKACRDDCIAKNQTDGGFSGNTDLITVDAPSVLGPDYDYLTLTGTESETIAKAYCDESPNLSCGDRRYCRDACNAYFAANGGSGNTNPPDNPGGDNPGDGISIEQAISDEAQRNTISFDGLAFLTGDLCCNTFLPPGKVADFSGFQYLRDTDPTNMGHNTSFVTIIAYNILNILTADQRSQMIASAQTQVSQINAYGYKRFPLIKAFYRLLTGDIPTGSTGLDKSAVMAFSADLYQIDGQISYDRAQLMGSIIRGMTTDQKAKLDALKSLNGVGNWDATLTDPLKDLHLTPEISVAVMTYASEMYSWYAGSVEADTYFCPERQGTYFGSFYMKDIPAMAGGPDNPVTIPSTLTSDMGSSFLNLLTTDQAALITGLLDIQRNDLNEIVTTRRSISTELSKFITTSDVDMAAILSLAKRYGELDGEIVYNYATSFVQVSKTLSDSQKTQLKALRESWNTISCSGAYLYSAPLAAMPEIINTDFLFGTTSSSVDVTAGSLAMIVNGFQFAEGPAANAAGTLYFSDITANRIYKWTSGTGATVFMGNSGGANGLFFDSKGNLLACQSANHQLVSIDSQGKVTVLAAKYNNKPFNEPNDLWIDAKGGVYFSDPLFFGAALSQDGQHVYYLTPKRDNIIRVVSDMEKPNGLIGTQDGKTLYVADYGAGETYKYTISENGSLTDKTLFVAKGSDGMTIDSEGNVYLTAATGIEVYSASGSLVETISVPEEPTNVCFGGSDGHTLYITAKTAVYSIPMRVQGVSSTPTTTPNAPVIQMVLPTSGISGGSITLTLTLQGDKLPSATQKPTSIKIGTLQGTNITWDGSTASAVFHIASTESPGTKDVSIEFSAASGTSGQPLVITKTGAFQVIDANTIRHRWGRHAGCEGRMPQ